MVPAVRALSSSDRERSPCTHPPLHTCVEGAFYCRALSFFLEQVQVRDREVGVLGLVSGHIDKFLIVLVTRKTALLSLPTPGEDGVCLVLAGLEPT